LHRGLQRHGISRLPDVTGDKPAKKKFKSYPIGYFHIDIAEVQIAEGKLYLYVAIDRTSKFAFVQLVKKTGRTSASAFLVALIKAVPYKIHTVLTDNVIQFTFPPRYADGPTARYMTHMFEMRCKKNGIEHRLTKIKHPWTNGQVERMNRTIKEATGAKSALAARGSFAASSAQANSLWMNASMSGARGPPPSSLETALRSSNIANSFTSWPGRSIPACSSWKFIGNAASECIFIQRMAIAGRTT
jgi:transposase-like protein